VSAAFAFGPATVGTQTGYQRPELSPTSVATSGSFSSTAPILLGYTMEDPAVGPGHAQGFAAARSNVTLFQLTSSTASDAPLFVHDYVTEDSLAAYRQQEDVLARSVTSP
jgi:hypothetical protein